MASTGTSTAHDGTQLQVHPTGVRAPLISSNDQQPNLMAPSSIIRSATPGSSNVGGPLLPRPSLGPSPPGPSPLFPPQAMMSQPHPQAAGAPPRPPFPPPGLPTTPPGAEMPPPRLLPPSGPPPSLPASAPHVPPISQPPHQALPVSTQPPPNFPPNLPPGASQLPPQLPISGLQSPPISSPPFPPGNMQISASGPPNEPQIRPPLAPSATSSGSQMPPNVLPPQLPPPRAPTTGPQPLPGGQNIPPPGGLQMSHHLPPNVSPTASVPSVQPPTGEQSIPSGFQMSPRFSPGAPQVPTTGPPSSIQTSHSGSLPGTPPMSSNQPHTPQVPPSNQQVPASPQLSSSGQASSPLQSPAQQGGSMNVDNHKSEDEKGGGGEVWYEHKMSDGRVYYSHTQTRKTTWDRPQNAKIMPHPGQQTPTLAGHMGSSGSQPTPFPGFPLPGMNTPSQLVPTRVWSEFKTPEGKPYFYNIITRVSVWEKPKDFDLIMPLPPELGAANIGNPSGLHAAVHPHPQSSSSRPPLMTSPLMFPQGQPPFNPGFPPGHPSQHPGPPPHMSRFPPPVQMPPGQQEGSSNGDVMTGEPEVMELDNDAEPSVRGGEVVVSETTQSSTSTPSTATHPDTASVSEGGGGDKKEEAPESLPDPTPVKEEPKGPRPTASIPIPGTPWSVVWTTDNRQFFFDVTSRVSLWIMPEELRDNPLVDKILENGPEGNKPAAKRMKLDEEGDGRGDEEEEEEMEEGGGLEIPVGPQVMVPVKSQESVEAEKKVAMIRSGKTLEERQEEFKDMLLERGVSAFSTWDKELPKFVFDPRYMLLNSKERKSCFEDFIRSRAEEERKEKRSKLKAKRDEFRKLLEDSKLHPKSSFSEFAQRHGKDERFKAVEKMREREQLFSDYLQELKKVGKHKEKADGTTHTSATKNKTDKVKSDFLEMLSEDHSLSESSQWRKVKGGFERDPRYRAVSGGSSQREEWFKEHIKSLATSSKVERMEREADPSRDREERIQASLKEREREVKMSRSAHEKEWGRERDQLRKTEAVQQFNAILADTVRNAGVVWNEARRQLRQDPRWDTTELLELTEKERLFQEHTAGLVERKRLQFRRLLEETSQISLVMPWKKARKLIREDPRYKTFTESDHRREAEYDKYLRDKMVTAKNEFRSLLRETKVINYKSHKLVNESEKHYKEITKVLENDKRYLVLECVSDERERILQDYMEELHLKGPPPPPTATNPSERLRK